MAGNVAIAWVRALLWPRVLGEEQADLVWFDARPSHSAWHGAKAPQAYRWFCLHQRQRHKVVGHPQCWKLQVRARKWLPAVHRQWHRKHPAEHQANTRSAAGKETSEPELCLWLWWSASSLWAPTAAGFWCCERGFPRFEHNGSDQLGTSSHRFAPRYWVLQYQLFDQFGPEASRTWTEAGKDLWLYHCIEPGGPQYLNTFAERPSIQGRLLFWLAALWEIQYGRPTGWLYYEMNVWKPCNGPTCGGAVHKHPIAWLSEGDFRGTAFTDWPEANFIWQGQYDTIFANGDGQFVYPCPDGPCGSVRLDAIRDGLEDWELFRAVGSEAVPLIKRVVQSPTKWNADPQQVLSIRAEAAKILMTRNANLGWDLSKFEYIFACDIWQVWTLQVFETELCIVDQPHVFQVCSWMWLEKQGCWRKKYRALPRGKGRGIA